MTANKVSDKGYDPSEVPGKCCMMCDEFIGDAEWEEVTTLARFGQMLFAHTGCNLVANAKRTES